MTKKLTTKEFIKKAKKIHGNKYDYSKVDYKLSTLKVLIGCSSHSWFELTPNKHLAGRGCKICTKLKQNDQSSLTQEEFIKRAKEIHDSKYDYSRVKYTHGSKKIIIGCPKHSWFDQVARDHLSGRGCRDCGIDSTHKKQSFTTEEFILKAQSSYGDMYDYSRVEYDRGKKVIIGCRIHSWFKISPMKHLYSNQGCSVCSKENQNLKSSLSQDEFIKRSIKVHGDKYDYTRISYKNFNSKIVIGCPKHSWFEQVAREHIFGKSGCPKCINKSEGKIAEYLLKKHIMYRNHKIKNEKKLYDFYLPDFNLFIERDGEQHYYEIEKFSRGDEDYIKKQQENDLYKTELAKKHGYKIARIPYWLNDEQVEREIDNILAGNPSYPDVPDLKQAETKPLPK